MITVYGSSYCPDCTYLDAQIEGNPKFQKVNISEGMPNLKAFLKIRDTNPLFDAVKEAGGVGIPCFVLEDGTVTLSPEEVGLKSRPVEEAPAACCGEKGC